MSQLPDPQEASGLVRLGRLLVDAYGSTGYGALDGPDRRRPAERPAGRSHTPPLPHFWPYSDESAERLEPYASGKTHVAHILMKLQLRDRMQAVVFAYENGVTTLGEGV